MLGIKLAMSTAYHPQTDGETEWVNQEVEVYLQMFCSNNPETWKKLLSIAEFSHNQRTHLVQKNLPFFLMLGCEPKVIPLPYLKLNIPAAEKRIVLLQKAQDEALATHELAWQIMAKRTTCDFTPFKKGEKVWLEGRNLKILYATKKLAPK